jgi:hypothetical protein
MSAVLSFSFADFTVPDSEPLTPFATQIAAHSLTFREIPHITTFNADCKRVQSVLSAILEILGQEEDVRPILRYTQAPVLGYIYEPFCEFIVEELTDAYEFINFWQLPTTWLTAIREEIAYLRYEDTGVLDPILMAKAEELRPIIYKLCAGTGIRVESAAIFRRTANTTLEMIIGRRLFPSTSPAGMVHYLNTTLCEKAARLGYADFLNHYRQNGCKFNGAECRADAYIGYYHSVTIPYPSLPFSFVPFVTDVKSAKQSPFYAVLKLLSDLGVPVDNSDGVMGLTNADERHTAWAMYGSDDAEEGAQVLDDEEIDEMMAIMGL